MNNYRNNVFMMTVMSWMISYLPDTFGNTYSSFWLWHVFASRVGISEAELYYFRLNIYITEDRGDIDGVTCFMCKLLCPIVTVTHIHPNWSKNKALLSIDHHALSNIYSCLAIPSILIFRNEKIHKSYLQSY